jgi:hypothetical protein
MRGSRLTGVGVLGSASDNDNEGNLVVNGCDLSVSARK